jgi:CheY-like chemotaxis protein
VRVWAQQTAENEVAVSVSDTGIGIAPTDQDLIFQDFVQLDHPIQRRVKGTGLGLPLSRKLAAFLGGSVEVKSEQGRGSTFTVRVPRTYRDPSRLQAPEPVVHADEAMGVPILFVEDNPETIMAYTSYLRGSGFQVISAATTREAEKALERIEPRAIVLDIVLRSEDTWAFMASLKKEPRTKHIPIIVASTIEDQAKGFHLGADAYIVKPVERADLLRELGTLAASPALPRVLIIDDSDLDRYVLKQHLKNMPIAISEETAGLPGLGKASETRPDLIFLDLTMPDMTGFEVLDELKRRPETRTIPVVVVTSRSLSDNERDRLSGQCADLIGKGNLSEAVASDAVRRLLKDSITK